MNEAQKQEIRNKILSRLQQIREEINATKAIKTIIVSDCAIDQSNRVEQIRQNQIAEENIHKKTKLLGVLESALSQIDQVYFGQCEICKQEIPIPRLLIKPESKRCVGCEK
jgi:DnaK suppressor protein